MSLDRISPVALRLRLAGGLLLALVLPAPAMHGITPQQVPTVAPFEGEAAAIFAVLNKQVADWNRGDLPAFAKGYKNSPDILFMGKTIARGFDQMLASYKAHYPTPESMGQLNFTQLDAQRLDAAFATVTGRFHLARTSAGGGDADGFFLLVMERTTHGWKIVRDDTTSLPSSTK